MQKGFRAGTRMQTERVWNENRRDTERVRERKRNTNGSRTEEIQDGYENGTIHVQYIL